MELTGKLQKAVITQASHQQSLPMIGGSGRDMG